MNTKTANTENPKEQFFVPRKNVPWVSCVAGKKPVQPDKCSSVLLLGSLWYQLRTNKTEQDEPKIKLIAKFSANFGKLNCYSQNSKTTK